MASKTSGTITYDTHFGHVCTCSEIETASDEPPAYENTVKCDPSSGTESGSFDYTCSRCGATARSGC